MTPAQQLVLGAGLEDQGLGIGHWHFGGGDGQRTISGAFAIGVAEHGILRLDFASGHIPLLGGGGDQHRLGARAGLAQLVPGARDRGRTASALAAIDFGIDGRLFHHDMVPVGVQFLGDDQAEGGLDALADFRRLGINGDGVVGGDADKGVDHLILGVAQAFGGRLRGKGGAGQMEAQHQARGGRARQLEEGAPLHRQRAFDRDRGRADFFHQRADIGVGLGKLDFGFGWHGVPPGK